MSNKGDEDVESELDDMDDLDLLDYSSQSQNSIDYGDFDKLLEPLSNSQQMREEELDRRDEQIRMDIQAEEERRAAEEHNKIVLKHQSKPLLIKARPPGLRVFTQTSLPTFAEWDLRLEEHFGWQGRSRLEWDVQNMEKMLDGEDMFYLVRYLTPEVTQNVMITCEDDFNSVVNYILFKAVYCKDRFLYEILKKCLFDLLKSYHYPWVFSENQFLTILLNLGADPKLINNQDFYDSLEFCQKPAVLPFSQREVKTRSIPVPVEERLIYLSHLFQIARHIFSLPGREEDNKKVDPQVWKTFVFISSVVAQEETIINSPEISQDISDLLHCLFLRFSTVDFQDVAELMTSRFLPRNMSDSEKLHSGCSSWSLPDHFSKLGMNHPHNMLHLTTLIPSQFSQLKQLVSFMNFQLILNNPDCDLPLECHIEDVINLISKDDNLERSWVQLDAGEQHYSCWCILHLLDILVLLDGYNYPKDSVRYSALKNIRSVIERCHVKGKVKDSLAIDSDKVTTLANDLTIRWKNILNHSDNLHSLSH